MVKKTGKNLRYLRKNNKSEILKFLTVNEGGSRVELSKQLGLSKMTITNIVSELIEADYLSETKINTKESMFTTGPKPMILEIRRNRILAIGVYLSRDTVRCALSDIIKGELVVKEEKLAKGNTIYSIMEQVVAMIEQVLCYDCNLNDNIIGIGFSTVGLVDSEKGILVKSTDFVDMDQINLKKSLEEKFKYPVFISNQMQAAALAEQLYGHGKKFNDFVYMGISDGVGAAVVTGGMLMKGSRGFAAEAGHMSLNYQGELCSCGNRGCLELYVSIPALLKKSDSTSIPEFLLKYKKGDARTLIVMENFIRVMGIALSNIANIFDPSCIIIGHEGGAIAELVLSKIEKLVHFHSMQKVENKLCVLTSSFKELDALRGAAALVFEKLFQGQITLNNKKED